MGEEKKGGKEEQKVMTEDRIGENENQNKQKQQETKRQPIY